MNAAWWPWPWHRLLLAAGLAGLAAVARGRAWRACGVGLGAAWLLCAAVFVHARYLPINWAVAGLLPALVLLALLLPVLGWRAASAGPPCKVTSAGPQTRAVAVALAAWALLLHPLLAPLSGAGWQQAEVLALAPDPTAVATLALLVALPRLPGRAWRAAVALAWLLVLGWCLFSGLMLAAMGSWNALVLAAPAVLAAAAAACERTALPTPAR